MILIVDLTNHGIGETFKRLVQKKKKKTYLHKRRHFEQCLCCIFPYIPIIFWVMFPFKDLIHSNKCKKKLKLPSHVLDTLLDVYCLSVCVFVLHRWQRGRTEELGNVPKPCLVPPVNGRAVSPLYGVWTLPQKRKPKADPALTRFTSAKHLLQSVYGTFYMLQFYMLQFAIVSLYVV